MEPVSHFSFFSFTDLSATGADAATMIYVMNYSYTELEEKSVGLIKSETKCLPKLSKNLLQNDYYHHR